MTSEDKLHDTKVYLVPGSTVAVKTSIGNYRIVVINASGISALFSLQWPGCVFDVLRAGDERDLATGALKK